MNNLSIENVMAILLRALGYIDVRLVDHGQRLFYTTTWTLTNIQG